MTDTAAPYRSPLLSRRGAAERVCAAGAPLDATLDATGVAWHYGDPLGEQRAMATAPCLVDRSHRTVIAVSGPDAATFLNNLLSQKLDDAPDGFSASALDLDGQGRILHHVDLTRRDDTFFLDCPAAQAETLTSFLHKMVFWSDVAIEPTDLAILSVLGAAAEDLFPLGGEVFYRQVEGYDTVGRRDVAVARADLASYAAEGEARGARLAGLMAFTAERVRACEPELGIDLDARSIPHEAPTLIARGSRRGAVHLNKGCYRGQETVARVENLGRSPRLLVRVLLDGSVPVDPLPHAPITLGGRTVGRLGTVVHDADYGPIGLALVKRSALDQGQLTVDGDVPVAASIDPDSLPTDEGEKAGRRAVQRLRQNQ